MNGRKDCSVKEFCADAFHVQIHQRRRQGRGPEERAGLLLSLHFQSVQRRQQVSLLLVEAEHSE